MCLFIILSKNDENMDLYRLSDQSFACYYFIGFCIVRYGVTLGVLKKFQKKDDLYTCLDCFAKNGDPIIVTM